MTATATTGTAPRLDESRRAAFAERLRGVLNGGALALMVSIGHRTGLFDTMARLGFATSEAIAGSAGLHERYVREWLAAMAAGGVVEVDAASGRYRLPPEHSACLTRAARPGNVAATAQWIPLLGGVEDRIVECFERGGGVPYAAYDRFHEVMVEESDQTVVAFLLESILPLVPGLPGALGRGLDVLDVGCGSGRALNCMAAAFPRSRFLGIDLSPDAVAAARAEAADRGLRNARFEVRDAADFERERAFDLVTAFGSIRVQAEPAAVLAAIARSLRGGGTFLMQDPRGANDGAGDAPHPLGPFLYTVSCFHWTAVSLAAGGAGLGPTWGLETAPRMLAEAGLRSVEVRTLAHDAMSFYYVARREG
jgi:SAM-dependent methyltransferase